MNHLSSEQISRVVAGIGIPEEPHIRECATCAGEVERAQSMFKLFGGSVREWTERLEHSEFPIHEVLVSSPALVARKSGRAPMAWVLATAALAAAVAIPVYRDSQDREVKARQLQDEKLLSDVKAQLSRNGPLAMDPLLRLMSAPVEQRGAGSHTESGSAGAGSVGSRNGGIQ